MPRGCGVNWSQATTGAGGATATACPPPPASCFWDPWSPGALRDTEVGCDHPPLPTTPCRPEDLTSNNTLGTRFDFRKSIQENRRCDATDTLNLHSQTGVEANPWKTV
jgi:hypothetical protein